MPIGEDLDLVGTAKLSNTRESITKKAMICFENWKCVFSDFRQDINVRRSLSVCESSPRIKRYLPISIFSSFGLAKLSMSS